MHRHGAVDDHVAARSLENQAIGEQRIGRFLVGNIWGPIRQS